MAARHIRRLQEQLEAKAAKQQADEVPPSGAAAAAAAAGIEEGSDASGSSSEGDDHGGAGAKPFNPFDLLTDDDKDSSNEDEDSSSEQEQDAEQDEAPAAKPQPVAAKQPASASKLTPLPKGKQQQAAANKGGGGGGKGKGAAEQQQKQKQQQQQSKQQQQQQQQQKQEDDIDKLLQELNMAPAAVSVASSSSSAAAASSSSTSSSSRRGGAAASSSSSSTTAAPKGPLLGVDTKRIRGDDELRRIFGAGVIEAVDRMEGGATGRRGGAAASGRAAVRRRQLKRFMLVAPADHWPHVDSGISMRQSGTTADGKQQFRYEWSPNYAAAQRVFEQAQASYDPNAVGAVLAQFPYHVDSLLAMNELYRSMGEAQTADDLLARALHALEGAWTHGFDPTTGNVRLDFEVPQNRGLFLALFRHAQALSRRGCHASALEVTKLLVALDPQDPVGGLLLLDYLALRAGAFSYLERFVAEFDSSSSALALLPNYAYALPMARLRLEQAAAAAAAGAGAGATTTQQQQQGPQTGPGSGVSSLTLLAQALLLHPFVFNDLLAKLQGQGAAREDAWQQLAKRKLFAKASDHGSSSLSHLASLFVERSHPLWKGADVLAWLQTAATAAADVADGKARGASQQQQRTSKQQQQPAGAVTTTQPDDVVIEGSAQDWACVARESFPPTERNEYGHLRLSDFSDAVNTLPQEEMQAVMAAGGGGAAIGGGGGGADGRAAAMEVLAQMEEEQLAAVLAAAQRQAGGGGAPAMPDEALQAANPLLMLLQSLLPWVNAGAQPDYAAGDEQQGQGGGGGGAGQPQ